MIDDVDLLQRAAGYLEACDAPNARRYAHGLRELAERINAGPAPSTAASFVVGQHPTCPACGSLVLPGGTCVNCRAPAATPTTGMEPVRAGWPCAECGKNPKLENSAICGDCLDRILRPVAAPVAPTCETCGGEGVDRMNAIKGSDNWIYPPCHACNGTGHPTKGRSE